MTLMTDLNEIRARIHESVDRERLVQTAIDLVGIPSPTRSAGAVLHRMAEILKDDGLSVERSDCGWPDAPVVIARLVSKNSGPTIQFNGHLDTVHLPYVAPRVENGNLYGTGASDMKGGVAAFIEATRAVRDSGLLKRGGILITGHDLHEAPWGDGAQIDAMIAAGFVGDAVLLPEYCNDPLPIIGRGLATLEIAISRDGEAVHEVLGGIDAPNVIYAGADLVREFAAIDEQLKAHVHPIAGRESLFVGQIHSGEMFNQSPVRLTLEGTRRWLPGTEIDGLREQLDAVGKSVASKFGVDIDIRFSLIRDAYEIEPSGDFFESFQQAHEAVTGRRLKTGAKPFVDDGNTFVQQAGIPAITHGPNATGAHTVNEEAPIDELVRVAEVYAVTALQFTGG